MALRTIRELGDPVLGKRAKEVREMTPKLRQLIADMKETMYEADGVGLAAPQVGMLKRIVVIDVSEEQNQPLVMINPEIIERSGEQRGAEGCLSFPDEYGIVTRPMEVTVRAQDRNGKEFTVSGTGLTARCFCHEIDHLDGIVFTSVCERMLTEEELENGQAEE